MHLLVGEVPAAAPALVEALPPILLLAGLLFALGCVVALHYFVQGLLTALSAISSWIPFVGSITEGVIHKVEQAVSNALGTAISKLEHAIAHQFHNLARVVAHLWRTIRSAAELIFALSVLAGAAVTLPVLHSIERPLLRKIAAARHMAARALNGVHDLQKEIGGAIPRHLTARLRAAEHAISDTLPRSIKSARELAREAEHGVARLWDRVRGIEARISDTAIAAAVAAAVAAIGLDWLACRSRSGVNGKAGCALWDDIEGLLGLATVALIALDFEQLVREMQAVEEVTVEAIHDALNMV